jgi:hypothetical protein
MCGLVRLYASFMYCLVLKIYMHLNLKLIQALGSSSLWLRSRSTSWASDNSWARTELAIFRCSYPLYKRLTIPKLSIDTVTAKKLVVRANLRHMSILQYQDLITVADRTKTVRHEHAGTTLVFKNAVDVLKKGLLRIGVEGRCLARSVDDFGTR